jgi:uncharacterized iron-regulated protein
MTIKEIDKLISKVTVWNKFLHDYRPLSSHASRSTAIMIAFNVLSCGKYEDKFYIYSLKK